MDTYMGVPYETVKVKNNVVGEFIKCIPSYRYRGYPHTQKKPAFSLLLEKLTVRPELYVLNYGDPMHQRHEYTSGNWWTDAHFRPNDDTVLFVTGDKLDAIVLQGSGNARLFGKIMALSLDKDNNGVHVFASTQVSVLSKLHVHPSGRCIGYTNTPDHFPKPSIGIGNIKILDPVVFTDSKANITTMQDEVLSETKGFCWMVAIAPDGKQLAKIVTSMPFREEEEEETSCCFGRISRNTKYASIKKYTNVVLSVLEKDLRSIISSVDLGYKFDHFLFDYYLSGLLITRLKLIECKWSQDSKHIAVCCAIHLCIFNRRLEEVFNISEPLRYKRELYMTSDMSPTLDENSDTVIHLKWLEVDQLHGTSKFDFDPRSCHELLAFGTADRRVCFINSTTKKIDAQTLQLSACPTDFIDCLQYHPFGKYVAVGTRNFTIYFVQPDDGTVLYSLDMFIESPALTQKPKYCPSIPRIAFSATGEQLVTATSDARVRVYQMPEEMSLFDKCKWVILSHVPQTKLEKLSLPKSVINRLLAIPIMK